MLYAPVVLFVYNRPFHTKQTLECLQKNALAEESDLYVFSDGPKGPNDLNTVLEVRRYLSEIKGFKSVTVHESIENKGLSRSILEGVNLVLKTHEKVIVLEDDIVTTTDFLSFMNQALKKYTTDKKVISVTGYTYPVKLPTLQTVDGFFTHRASSWGWGTWKDRWIEVDWEVKDYSTFINSQIDKEKFMKGGEDLPKMLEAQKNNKIDSWAIRWNYFHFKNEGFSFFPYVSRVQNIGLDDSGTHCSSSDSHKVILGKIDPAKELLFPKLVEVDEYMTSSIKKFHSSSLKYKIINRFKSLLKPGL